MRILTKKAFLFVNPDPTVPLPNPSKMDPTSAKKFVRTGAGEVQDVPDWVRETKIFEWGRKDGDILVIESERDIAQAELPKGEVLAEENATEAIPDTAPAGKGKKKAA